MGIEFSALIDILFLLNIMVKNFVLLNTGGRGINHSELLDGVFKNENIDFKLNIFKILELLKFLVSVDFFADQFL